MEIKVIFSACIKCSYSIGKKGTFIVKRNKERLNVFRLMGTWNDAHTYEILQACSNLRREVEILQNNRSSRWATTASFEKEITISREGKCDVMLFVEVFVSSLDTVYDNMTGAKLAVPVAIKHISDNPITWRKVLAISHLLDHCWIMKESLKSRDKGNI
jgi:hypothetical protein